MCLSAAVTATPASADAAPCATPRPWCDTALSPQARADRLVAAMTVDQQSAVITGQPVADLGVPSTNDKFVDGPIGAPAQIAGFTRPATALPSGSALGATFDVALARRYGEVIGSEARAYGFYGTYGPTLNILRTPFAGRGHEYYGEDPWLVSQMAVPVVRGVQAQGVAAQIKHFVANDQEGQIGVPPTTGVIGGRFFTNVRVDERTLREVYLAPFEAAIKAGGALSVMCSYNALNGQYACENPWLLTKVLREDWGFAGSVSPDLGADHNPIANFQAGMDENYRPGTPQLLLAARQTNEQAIADHARHQLYTMFASGVFDRPPLVDDPSTIDVDADNDVAQRVEESGAVLLRNERAVLPLDPGKIRSIAVVGPAADTYQRGSGSMQVTGNQIVTLLDGIRRRAGSQIEVTTDDGALPARAAAVARAADVAIVAVNDQETEGADKLCITLSCPAQGIPFQTAASQSSTQDSLIDRVAAANPNTVVVLQVGEPILTPWRTKVAALLQAWYPGGRGGTAVARILFGDVNPSGRLPSTFPASDRDGYATSLTRDVESYPGIVDQSYKEGVLVGHRWYDAKKLDVAYPFGFGLSYTTFAVGRLTVAKSATGFRVRATVRNTGNRAGSAVPQLYLGRPEPRADVREPPSTLKGFAKVTLDPGQSARVAFDLDQRALSYWDTTSASWQRTPGCVAIKVGFSSRDLPLRSSTCEATRSACVPRRSVSYTLPRSARRVRLVVDGRRRKASVRRNRVRVSLRGLRRQRVTIRITARVHGKVFRRVSRVHPCRVTS
jgi:beta-glucosidase